jgi:DNA-binding NtrC family response regulator
VPPLRERPEDISLLVQSFVARAGSSVIVSPAVMSALESHHWPGNVRELEHHVQRLLALGVPRIERAHLPRALRPAAAERGPSPVQAQANADDPRSELERALREAGGNITHAARALGLTRHGLKKRMLRLGLRARAGGD